MVLPSRRGTAVMTVRLLTAWLVLSPSALAADEPLQPPRRDDGIAVGVPLDSGVDAEALQSVVRCLDRIRIEI